jgi:P27 family predicted phage terminase small subunit
MPGPVPKPTALKLLAGNPGNRPLNPYEPKPALAVPSCPSHLDKEARREWRRIVPELTVLGLLTRVDRAALAAYCVAYSRWITAEREVQRTGLTVVSPNGYPQKSPHLAIADKALEQVRKFAAEFGLTPASRSKVTAAPTEDPDEDFFAVRR